MIDNQKQAHFIRTVKGNLFDAEWNKAVWQAVPLIELTHHMGEIPAHFPHVQVKVAYDNANLHLVFRVEDQYVKAVAQKHQDSVCTDSCVEFFFTPGTDLSLGYMNLEMNCCGKILFQYQKARDVETVPVSNEDLKLVEIAHSLPQEMIEEEIQSPLIWTIECRIPFELIAKYMPMDRPAPGVQWRGNFYKCADGTSHPHWLSWSPVEWPHPDFHRPEFFGMLEFRERS